jgi:GIY-YIG catalytic domain
VDRLSVAVDGAPDGAGVYFFFGADAELLYVGKASSLRKRLRQHARAKPGVGGLRLDVLYQRVIEVRWEALADEETAAAREADAIVALRPVFNAAIAGEGRWNYIVVESLDPDHDTVRFTLSELPSSRAGKEYGCFPHLGRGVSSRPGIACSDGYTALLRLLWAASDTYGRHVPSRITRSAPDLFETEVTTSLRKPLHAFLSGTSDRLLADLAALQAPRERYFAPGLARDRVAANDFFLHGPRALRNLRTRHGRPAGPMSRAVIEALVVDDLRAAIGDFQLPRPPDAADEMLGRRAHRWVKQ